MLTFEDLEFKFNGFNHQALVKFPNGYGVSVVIGPSTYGGNEGLYELAVLHDGDLCYDTPVTSDVEGYLTPAKVTKLMEEVQKLEPK